MPGDFCRLLLAGLSENHPGVILRDDKVDVLEAKGLTSSDYCKCHARAVEFVSCNKLNLSYGFKN
jgi:hypothetical protein